MCEVIGILVTLPREAQGVVREMEVKGRPTLVRGWAVEGKLWGREVVLAGVGMGRRSCEVASSLIKLFKLDLLMSCSFGGGLVEGLKKGEAVICQSILSLESQVELSSDNHFSLLAARALARAGIPFSWGRGLTVSRIISEPKEKLALAQKYGGKVVEMENFWEAEVAIFSGTPFLAVRFISDTLKERLPKFERFVDPEGNLEGKKFPGYFLMHPFKTLTLPRLFLSYRRVEKNLRLFLKAYLKEFDESSGDRGDRLHWQ